MINGRVMGELAVSRAFGDNEFKKGIQSIIDEEGVKMASKEEGEEGKNWDQPLIIAKPDVEVGGAEHEHMYTTAVYGAVRGIPGHSR